MFPVSSPTVDERSRLTGVVAIRLMKSRARHHVYSERAKSTRNPALSYVTSLEREILIVSEKDWRTVLKAWWRPRETRALASLLVLARDHAVRDVAASFDDQTTIESLARFFQTFKPEALL